MNNARLGIALIASAITAIVILVSLAFSKQHDSKMEHIRVQGTGVVRALQALPIEVLAAPSPGTSVLQSLFSFYKPEDFAYGSVVTLEGKLLAEVVKPGVMPPAPAFPAMAGSRINERTLELAQGRQKVVEFYAPLVGAVGETAFIRVGYFEPHYTIAGEELSYFAMLALITFMIVPVVYFLLLREMTPLKHAFQKLQGKLQEQQENARTEVARMDVEDLARRLDEYVDSAGSRLAALKKEKNEILTKSRLLEYANNKLNFVLQNLPEGLIVLDPAGHITFVNGKIPALLGVDIAKVLSSQLEEWCEDSPLKNLLARYQSASPHSTRPETIEFQCARTQDRRIRAVAQPLVAQEGEAALGTLIVLQDASREYASQCASQDFVAHVSHELKSPLNVINMYCEMLQLNGVADDASRIEAVNIIHDEVERMTGLIGNLLSISKVELGGFKPKASRVKIEELLQDIYQNNSPKAREGGLEMELAVQREIGALSADKDMLRIAINNLVSNAIKYSDRGGRVILGASEERGYLTISVQDTGIGIPKDEQAHIFKKFFRAQGGDAHRRSGHGLGLYLANEIVQLHHGQISLESTPGEGSRFSIQLKAQSIQELNLL